MALLNKKSGHTYRHKSFEVQVWQKLVVVFIQKHLQYSENQIRNFKDIEVSNIFDSSAHLILKRSKALFCLALLPL